MNPGKLLEHFDRISEAEGAVAKLRSLILNLAVSGKLVPQLRTEESAAEALIASRKFLREQASSLRKGIWTPSQAIAVQELPSVPPSNWIPATVNDTGFYINGIAFNPTDWKRGGTPIIRIQNLTDPLREFNFAAGDFPDEVIVRDGDLLVSWSATLDAFVWSRGVGVLNQHIFRVLPAEILTYKKFLHLLLRNAMRELGSGKHAHGLTIKHINRGPFLAHVVLIPPMAEQHRIVAKFEELMAVCDQLEAVHKDRDRSRDSLVSASLQRLEIAGSKPGQAQKQDVQFYLNHLFRLTTTPDHLKQLRKTIYSLAVRGLLVAQDKNEEPAEALLKTIRLEKAQLTKAGPIASKKATSRESSLPFPLPENWQAVSLGEVCNFITSGSRGWAAFYSESGPRFLRAQNIRFGRLRLDDVACVNPPVKTEGERTQVRVGDLLIVITGSGVTNPALLDRDLGEAYVSQHVALLRPTTPALSKWLLLCLMSGPGGRDELVERAYGSGKPGLNLGNIRTLNAPIPPLGEQNRIIAKVEELIGHCDELEALISSMQADRNALLETLLERTLGIARGSSRISPAPPTSAKSNHINQVGTESRFMTTSPANSVDQLLECIDDLGGATTPELLLMQTGLSKDVEAFYDLIRAARDSGKLSVSLGAGEKIRRVSDAN